MSDSSRSDSRAPLKVLIIEDTPADAELAAEVLMGTWPQLEWRRVINEAEFRDGLTWTPDIIIADYEVPGFGAVAALSVLHELGSEIPLIVFTGAVNEETVVRSMRLGAADYLIKDRLTRLGTAVSNALRMRRDRDDKRTSEREQRRLAEINSAILSSLPAQVALLDVDGHIVAVNAAWQHNGVPHGFNDPTCEVGGSYIEVCKRAKGDHAVDAISVVQGISAVLAGKRDSFALEYPCHVGAERQWLRIMATPVTRGGKGGAVVMLLDVTDRKLAEEQLKINANALRHLTEGVIITDADLRIVTVNKAFTTMTGYTSERTLGMRLAELIVRDDTSSLIDDISATVTRDGGWKGELRSRRASGELFPAYFSFSAVRDASGAIEYYTAVFTDLSAYREFERRIEYLSQNDVLTGLPNRAALAKQVQDAIPLAKSSGASFAFLVAELDSFKTVNDTVGHATGDLLLKSVAERLQRINRPGDGLARLGGDEFGLLAVNLSHPAEAERLAERLRTAIERPFRLAGQNVFITASIGVSSFPNDGQDFESLLRAADAAVYRAKQLGRNTVSWYSPEMNIATVERFTLQNGLPQALAKHEFLLEYQPTIDLRTGRVTGAEALIRWRHPKLGLVGPTRFISLAEDTGLIVPIGEWVLRTACQQVNRWIAAGWSDAAVAVNLSARQFSQSELPARIALSLSEAAIEPWRLRLEVTESMLMSDPEAAANVLNRLASMGIQLALDDFGTGYSSLNYLKRFRLGCLKVDRSFVSGVASNAEDASIVRAIVALGRTLGMKIIAEGVETSEQAEFLRDAGCDDGQGYYYSPATSAADVRAMAMNPFPLAAGSLQSQLDLVVDNPQ
ncbi:MAG: EAL domain-containing protein [Candidatus Obscuribacterales bacterium]|nr:EAL domain-containing protein [Steroidobacteraceae bacterium]